MTNKEAKTAKFIKITDDIWFYVTNKGFEFTVWSPKFLDQRKCTLFTLSNAKLKKYHKK